MMTTELDGTTYPHKPVTIRAARQFWAQFERGEIAVMYRAACELLDAHMGSDAWQDLPAAAAIKLAVALVSADPKG